MQHNPAHGIWSCTETAKDLIKVRCEKALHRLYKCQEMHLLILTLGEFPKNAEYRSTVLLLGKTA